MTTREYKIYKKNLEKHGYEYCPNHPFDGDNSWIKRLNERNGVKASVLVREYDHREIADRITLSVVGIVSVTEEVVARTDVHFGYDPDLDFVEVKMQEYWDLFSKKEPA